jgi:riboflavin biosynthesis pyrimidine reductase
VSPEPLGALRDLLDASEGTALPLPPALAAVYGTLRFPENARPHVISNFVASVDGVVSLAMPRTGGAEISGGSREDRAVMGLLRAVADFVVIGAGTLRAFPRHIWTPEAIDPDRAVHYALLRRQLGKPAAPTTVLVTASGDLDLSLPVFRAGGSATLVVTTKDGARRLSAQGATCDVRVTGDGPRLEAAAVMAALQVPSGGRILLEGGPQLMGTFLDARRVDELFLTLAPQVIGRTPAVPREGLTSGVLFFPDRPLWGRLVSVKTARDLLFLRYSWPRT